MKSQKSVLAEVGKGFCFLFCKGLDSQYFKLCRSDSLCCDCSSLPLECKGRQTLHSQMGVAVSIKVYLQKQVANTRAVICLLLFQGQTQLVLTQLVLIQLTQMVNYHYSHIRKPGILLIQWVTRAVWKSITLSSRPEVLLGSSSLCPEKALKIFWPAHIFWIPSISLIRVHS